MTGAHPPPYDDGDPGAASLLLRRAAAGDAVGQSELFELLFSELHRLAGGALARQPARHTLQPTALVGEVWLRLFAGDPGAFRDRAHFLATAARAMRQALVDHARARLRLKRGADRDRVELTGLAADDSRAEPLDLIELDLALEALRAEAPRAAEVVELRFFGGLEVDEVAQTLGLSASTVAREWRFARAWLIHRMGES